MILNFLSREKHPFLGYPPKVDLLPRPPQIVGAADAGREFPGVFFDVFGGGFLIDG